jgi:hypothetical protein
MKPIVELNLFLKIINIKEWLWAMLPYAHIGIPVKNYADLPSDKGEMVHHRDGTTGCYVKDPDGNIVEFIHYSEECSKDMKI